MSIAQQANMVQKNSDRLEFFYFPNRKFQVLKNGENEQVDGNGKIVFNTTNPIGPLG
jgi:hypothetical protein